MSRFGARIGAVLAMAVFSRCAPDGGNLCGGVSCSGRGFCVAQEGAAYCACLPGHHPDGLSCLINSTADPCEGVRCSFHGGCRVEGGGPTCDCDAGYGHLDDDRCDLIGCDLLCLPIGASDGGPDADADADSPDADGPDADSPDALPPAYTCTAVASATYEGLLVPAGDIVTGLGTFQLSGVSYLVATSLTRAAWATTVGVYGVDDPLHPTLLASAVVSNCRSPEDGLSVLDESTYLVVRGHDVDLDTVTSILRFEPPDTLSVALATRWDRPFGGEAGSAVPLALFRAGGRVLLATQYTPDAAGLEGLLPVGTYPDDPPDGWTEPLVFFDVTDGVALAAANAVGAYRVQASTCIPDGRDYSCGSLQLNVGSKVTPFVGGDRSYLLVRKQKTSSGHFHAAVTEYEFIVDVTDPAHCVERSVSKVETLFGQDWELSEYDRFFLQFDAPGWIVSDGGGGLAVYYHARDEFTDQPGVDDPPWPSPEGEENTWPRDAVVLYGGTDAEPCLLERPGSRTAVCLQHGGGYNLEDCGNGVPTATPSATLALGEFDSRFFARPLVMADDLLAGSGGVLAGVGADGALGFFDSRSAAFAWATADTFLGSAPTMVVDGLTHPVDTFGSAAMVRAGDRRHVVYLGLREQLGDGVVILDVQCR